MVRVGFLAAVPALLLITLIGLHGCVDRSKSEQATSQSEQPTIAPEPADPMTLAGEGGELALGDTLEDAKKAFPMPKGASPVPDPELSRGEKHWGWEADDEVFDAYEQDGRLDWFSHSSKLRSASERDAFVAAEIEAFGKPNDRAAGKLAEAMVWELDDGLRVLIRLDSGESQGIVRVVGYRQALGEQGLPVGNLKAFVETLDKGSGR